MAQSRRRETDHVRSRHDLADYVDQLREDLIRDPDKWENATLERYLNALAAYLRDMDGYNANNRIDADADSPTWRLFADALTGSTIYE